MPKIKITEKDITGSRDLTSTSNTVYIPGKTRAPQSGETVAPEVPPTLCETEDELVALDVDKTTLSFRLAHHLIKLGMKVVYEGINEENGQIPSSKTFEELKDRGLYDIRYLTTGQYGQVLTNLVDVASARGDCAALLDHKKRIEVTSGTYASNVRAEFNAFNGTEYKKGGNKEGQGKFASAFTPWFRTKNKDLIESNGTTEEIPASFGYLFAYAKGIVNNISEWNSIAGSQRGIIDELDSLLHTYTSAEIEVLQARASTGEVGLDEDGDNVGFAINPIAYIRPFGNIIWGNRTLFYNEDGDTLKASSFLNVRNLVSTVKKKLYDAARKYTFEQNDDTLWTNFTNEVIPTLDKMVTGNGILGYRFERLETPAKARVKGRLTIVPIEAVEDFELEVLISDSLDVAE